MPSFLGQFIHDKRIEKGLSLDDLVDQVPATPETLDLIEKGEILDNINDDILGALASALDVETSQLRELKNRGLSTSEMPAFYSAYSSNRLFNSFTFADTPEWIPYLPLPGIFTHPTFGKVEITSQGNRLFVSNFNEGIYQARIPIDAEHETKLSGAMGWIVELRQNANGSVDARVEWTKRGIAMIEDDRFRFFSPEWFTIWRDPANNKVHENVAIGGALTTRPFFKEKALRPLIANEGIISMATRIGDSIARIRQEKELSQGEFAQMLPIAVSTLAQIERGEIVTPSSPVIKAIAKALGVSESSLRSLLPQDAEPNEEISRNNEGELLSMPHKGSVITEIRQQKGWSLEELAQPLSITAEVLGQIERNEIEPSPSVLGEIAEALDVNVEMLLPDDLVDDEEPEFLNNDEMTEEKNTMSENVDKRLDLLEKSLRASESQNEQYKIQATELVNQLKQATERIVAMETTAQSLRFNELIANGGEYWAGELSNHLTVLSALSQQFGEDSEQFKTYVSSQKALATQLSNSEMFQEVGSTGGGKPADAEGQIEHETRRIMSENKDMSHAVAYMKALELKPELYDQYMKEQGGK